MLKTKLAVFSVIGLLLMVAITGGVAVFLFAAQNNTKQGNQLSEVITAYQRLYTDSNKFLNETETSLNQPGLGKANLNLLVEQIRTILIKDSYQLASDANHEKELLDNLLVITSVIDDAEFQVKQRAEQALKPAHLQAKVSFNDYRGKLDWLIGKALKHYQDKLTAISSINQRNQGWLWIWILAWTGLAVVLTAIFMLSFVRHLQANFDLINQGSEQLAKANLQYRIKLAGSDEFSVLAKNINNMARHIQGQYQKLNDSRTVLEKKVEQRTSMLLSLNNELNKTDEKRRQFLSDISHELRTPLTVLRGEAELMLRANTYDPDECRDGLSRILDLSVQLGKYVNDVIGMARNESLSMVFNVTRFDVAELISATVDDLVTIAKQKALAVNYSGIKQGVYVAGDVQRLKQLFLVLFDNACRYSRNNGSIRIEVRLEANTLYLDVADSGIGIPADDLPLIFQRKFRSQNAIEHMSTGTGLGLSIAKTIAEAHDGDITVSSQENIGTTFTVNLPVISI